MSNTQCPRCPKCYSSQVDSNKIVRSHGTDHAAEHFIKHNNHSHPIMTLVLGGTWAVSKVIDAFSENYECKSCNHKFS